MAHYDFSENDIYNDSPCHGVVDPEGNGDNAVLPDYVTTNYSVNVANMHVSVHWARRDLRNLHKANVSVYNTGQNGRIKVAPDIAL